MGTSATPAVQCGHCGAVYKWKPELAGRKVRCKCGQVIAVPPAAAPNPALSRPAARSVPVPAPTPPRAAGGGDDFDQALSALAQFADTAPAPAEGAGAGPACPSCGAALSPGAVLCVNCGHDLRSGKKLSAQVIAGDEAGDDAPAAKAGGRRRSASAGAGAGAGAGVLPYRRGATAPADVYRQVGNPALDLYVPAGLVLAGSVIGYLDLARSTNAGPGVILFALGVLTLINLVLVFVGILAAVKLLDLGLGPIGPALVKIAAIAVFPGAVGGLIRDSFDATSQIGPYLGWVVSLLLVLALFRWLLDLDFQETLLSTAIIWVVRTWLAMFLTLGLLHGFGMSLSPRGGGTPALAGGGGGGGSGGTVADPKTLTPQQKAQRIDDVTVRAVRGLPESNEAGQWVVDKNAYQTRHLLSVNGTTLDKEPSAALVKELYGLGAEKVMVAEASAGQFDMTATQLVLTLPADPAKRKALFAWEAKFATTHGLKPMADYGQKYMNLDWGGSNMEEDEILAPSAAPQHLGVPRSIGE